MLRARARSDGKTEPTAPQTRLKSVTVQKISICNYLKRLKEFSLTTLGICAASEGAWHTEGWPHRHHAREKSACVRCVNALWHTVLDHRWNLLQQLWVKADYMGVFQGVGANRCETQQTTWRKQRDSFWCRNKTRSPNFRKIHTWIKSCKGTLVPRCTNQKNTWKTQYLHALLDEIYFSLLHFPT